MSGTVEFPAPPRPRHISAVVIGASAGALEALSELLPVLPANYPVPVMSVVHLPPDRKSVIVECLRIKSRIKIYEAEDKLPIEAGTVYFAPPDYHLLIERDHRLSLSNEAPIYYSRPSIDVLFESAADIYGEGLIGVVLTGANRDGAAGLKKIMDEGGLGLVQRPDLAHSSEMPQAALAACPDAYAMSVGQIANYLVEAVTQQ